MDMSINYHESTHNFVKPLNKARCIATYYDQRPKYRWNNCLSALYREQNVKYYADMTEKSMKYGKNACNDVKLPWLADKVGRRPQRSVMTIC